jgi:hypothetical protein
LILYHFIGSKISGAHHISDREYSKMTDRTKPTRALDFGKLIELGLIERKGKGKATFYKLKKY